MDFLRRLSPAYRASSARAVPVLPSRFAGASPLSEAAGAGRSDDDGASDAAEARPAMSAQDGSEPRENGIEGRPGRPISAAIVAVPPTQQTGGALPSDARSKNSGDPADAARPRPRPAEVRGATERPATDVRTAEAIPRERRLPADDRIAPRKDSGEPAPADRASNAKAAQGRPFESPAPAPLSEAAIADRRARSAATAGEAPVVHVTIGRVELVANVAPAAAPRRAPSPKSSSVPLSDYLRGGNGRGRSGSPG